MECQAEFDCDSPHLSACDGSAADKASTFKALTLKSGIVPITDQIENHLDSRLAIAKLFITQLEHTCTNASGDEAEEVLQAIFDTLVCFKALQFFIDSVNCNLDYESGYNEVVQSTDAPDQNAEGFPIKLHMRVMLKENSYTKALMKEVKDFAPNAAEFKLKLQTLASNVSSSIAAETCVEDIIGWLDEIALLRQKLRPGATAGIEEQLAKSLDKLCHHCEQIIKPLSTFASDISAAKSAAEKYAMLFEKAISVLGARANWAGTRCNCLKAVAEFEPVLFWAGIQGALD